MGMTGGHTGIAAGIDTGVYRNRGRVAGVVTTAGLPSDMIALLTAIGGSGGAVLSSTARICVPDCILVPMKALPTAGLIGCQLTCSVLTTSSAVVELLALVGRGWRKRLGVTNLMH